MRLYWSQFRALLLTIEVNGSVFLTTTMHWQDFIHGLVSFDSRCRALSTNTSANWVWMLLTSIHRYMNNFFFITHGYTHSLQYLHSYLDYLQKTSTYTHIICNISCSVWWIPSLTVYKGLHYLDYLQCGTYILTIQYDHLRY